MREGGEGKEEEEREREVGVGKHMCRIKLFILGIVYNFQFNGHGLCLGIITENFLIYKAANCIGIWNGDCEPLSL